jgi:hypothetical protein
MKPTIFLLLAALSAIACELPPPQAAAARADLGNSGIVPAPAVLPDTAVLSTSVFRLVATDSSLTLDALQALTQELEPSAQAILAFAAQPGPSTPLTCYVYPSTEQKGLQLRDTRQAHADFERPALHYVLHEAFAGKPTGAEHSLLLRQLLGKPLLAALEEGLAVYFTPRWQGPGYGYWSARLFRSGNMMPLAELLDQESFARESPLVRGCLSASFVAFLLERWGREAFHRRYASWQPTAEEIAALEREWHQFLQQQALPPAPAKRAPLPYLKGFNFAHEGYAIYNGYGSRLAREALQQQAALGSSAVALVPYSYLREPRQPAFIPVVTRAGAETDEGVIQDAYAARQLGMAVVLKPQLWLGRGRWPGDVEMENEADWQAFFNYYYRWMRHYALLAEIHEMEMLCVGVEFAKASLQRPDDWRRLIRKLRGIYSGPLTYAANWGEEFENLAFWDELDYIGLNCYYPLSKRDDPSDEELTQAFGQVLRLAERVSQRYGKPLVFTEIGFTSTPTPWREPHRDRDGSPYDGLAQERCYRIVLERLIGQDWARGILWWKYPSYLSHGGPGQTGFTPCGKPAEGLLPRYFERLR